MSELPNGWVQASIADVTLPFASIDPTKAPKQKFRYADIGSIDNQTQTITDPKSFLGRDAPSRARRVIRTGDTLFSTVRTYLKNIALVGEDMDGELTSTGIAVLRPSGAVDKGYLFRWACSDDFVAPLSGAQDGTMYPAVSDRDVAVAPVPLPPLVEQRRIVAKIDGLSTKSSRARERLDHIPRLVEKYKQAVFVLAFRGDLTREWRAKGGVTDAVPLTAAIEFPYQQSFTAPSSWKLFRFEQVCTIEGGSQPPKSTFEYVAGPHLIRFVQIRDYKSDDRVTFIPRALARRFCAVDDIMIGRYGPPIFQILRGIEGAYNVALMKAVPDKAVIEKEYLYRYLSHPDLRAYVEFEAQRTAGQDGVNKRHLLAWPILLPPVDEQNEIVRRIDHMMAWIDRLASEATSARKLIDHLDQAVLAKAFRGELVPQDPNDEPASILLERIRVEQAAGGPVKRSGRGKQKARANAGAV